MDTIPTIGLDIGKTTVVAARLGERRVQAFANTPAGHARLVCWAQHAPVELVVLEATGRYHLGIWAALETAGIAGAVGNPR